MIRIAVVQFPGSNCERETKAALEVAGARAEIVRWNVPREVWSTYDGYCLPGGFSYEDRVRAGAVAAKHALLDEIAKGADAGKPVLGVCNGAQILVEAGLVPGIEPGHVEVAIGRNAAPEWSGYYCGWVHVVAEGRWAQASAFPNPKEPRPLPVGHGEGRFVARPEILEDLDRRGQVAFRYVAPNAGRARGFPENPNGSLRDIAGLCDPTGHVVALMPHPERGAWLYQVPETLSGSWGRTRRQAARDPKQLLGSGPGRCVYESFVRQAELVRAGTT